MKRIFNIFLLSIVLISSGICLDAKERSILSKKLFNSVENKKIENVISSRSENFTFSYKGKQYSFMDRIVIKTKYKNDVELFTKEFEKEFSNYKKVLVRLFIVSPVQNDDGSFDITLQGARFKTIEYVE